MDRQAHELAPRSRIAPSEASALRARLIEQFRSVRAVTERLSAPLSAEDQLLQSMPSCSPTKWHRAHVTWFFETFVLAPHGVAPFDERWSVLFNSYYVALGPRHARPKRGLLSRPSMEEVAEYRRTVDGRVVELLSQLDERELAVIAPTIELGVAHEQQHQELLLTDILHALHENPLLPAYRTSRPALPHARRRTEPRFFSFVGGLHEIGASPSASFRFDNEEPRHRVVVRPFALADRLVTVGEWKAFADDGGYDRADLWLSEGFEWTHVHDVRAPLYARRDGTALVVFGFEGEREAHDDEPITNLSLFEADAIARFLGGRLPTEAEWELGATRAGVTPTDGNFLDDDVLHALPAEGDAPVRQLFGDAWEWTSSAYAPYPGYRPAAGALGEYNGKFMVNQMVLRGGSCLTPRGHVRPTYRNFWPTDTRFQMTSVRVARDLEDE